MRKQGGFTLVELAIVLVIIGLILGMAFKGKDLIDGAKVKNMQAQYNKVTSAFNTYYEKYGAYPGDGCPAATSTDPSTCTGARNGQLTQTEALAAISILQETGILSAADVQSVFGQAWAISPAAVANGNYAANTSYLTLPTAAGTTTTPAAAADVRFVCALDRQVDDGLPTGGIMRSSGTYSATDDCWALDGLVSMGIRVLP
ncbi:type II secretion system protein [Chitinilyticum piscinae]|uniref:Prepilin-type N-terminal cleavage/methylation domain-containing protein n=1 Tax=Chitinilyticum piscinae TaxID=2866724 RepID=A0A8J7K923_9NEIS|nr:prepilin-type N-terminal cleavage/methylation domain-containing protein [Chitinilyticum piscinae]MBE9610558.1 prepilin-type N-terminal cleavage/methylation domain-containing protein [Chitinilyticum piscinae]